MTSFYYVFLLAGLLSLQPALSPITYYFFSAPLLQCDVEVDAGPDTSICFPGGELMLMGMVTGNAVIYEWSPASGLDNPMILNPTADITGPITYTLKAWGIDPESPNLVVNGSFDSGNVGFTSDYTYIPNNAGNEELEPEGTYTVLHNPSLVHFGFEPCADHSPVGNNMMIINGSSELQNVWCQSVNVEVNAWYDVSAWVASVHSTSPAVLQFSINGTPIGPIINAPSATCQWIPFNASWYSGSNTSASICILNLNTTLLGNDFAIDDIAMRELCSAEDDVHIDLLEENIIAPEIVGDLIVCEGDIESYQVTLAEDPEIISYQWIIPPGATILSGQGTPSVTIEWEDVQEATLCIVVESRCDESEGCIEVFVNGSPEVPFISGPSIICPGESINFQTPIEGADDIYQWILPPELTLLNGQGTDEIEVLWNGGGTVEICLLVSNDCGSDDNCKTIQLRPQYVINFDTTLCGTTTLLINGNFYGNGVWSGTEHFIDTYGCDSIVQIQINEAPAEIEIFTDYLCPGDSVFLGGSFQSTEGLYVDSFITLEGCDSLMITEVIFSLLDTTWATITTCNQGEAGIDIVTYNNGLCDSTVITETIYSGSNPTLFTSFSCMPADTGQIIQHLLNIAGCDSIIVTNILLVPSHNIMFSAGTCDPALVGITLDSFTNTYGCDSIVSQEYLYQESDTILLTELVCSYSDTGTTMMLLVNDSGCDSLVILNQIYAGSETSYIFLNSCLPADTGTIINTLINQNGCDSVVITYTQLLLSDTTYLTGISCIPADTGVSLITLNNVNGCDSLIITSISLDISNACVIDVTFSVTQPLCFGDSALLEIQINAGLEPFVLTLLNDSIQSTHSFPSLGEYFIPLTATGNHVLLLSTLNGLSINDTILINAVTPLIIDVTTNMNSGYELPCFGDTSGTASVQIISEGTPPLNIEWSTGNNSQLINNLSQGVYSVLVTDTNGCTTTDTVYINAPPLIQHEIAVQHITCFGFNDGALSVVINGGIPPFLTSFDVGPFISNFLYYDLTQGMHQLVIKDQNECIIVEPIVIEEPSDWSISVGNDTTTAIGSTVNLEVQIHGTPAGMPDIKWSDNACDQCMERTVETLSDITLVATAIDENGCIREDEITIKLDRSRNVFIPNVFSPNDDNLNDYFVIYSTSIIEIEELSIYDRWGNKVFQNFIFQPNVEVGSWDGMWHGSRMGPAVFTYKAIVRYKDGLNEVLYGDVTVVR